MKLKSLLCISIVFILGALTIYFVSHRNQNKIQELKTTTSTAITTSTSSISDTVATSKTSIAASVANSSNISTTNNAPKTATIPDITKSSWIKDEMNAIHSQVSNLNQNVLKLALTAYDHAKKAGITNNPLLTIVDYSIPSTKRRLWVIDLINKKVLFNTWVAHGKNSGNINSSSFSNTPESLKSSLGVFVTNKIYSGKHGDSLRVQGLEAGFNDNAYSRNIVFHGAQYVSASIAKSGRLGRSWGCWAVSQDIISSLVKTIKTKALVVAYYPDQKWLSKSSFLN